MKLVLLKNHLKASTIVIANVHVHICSILVINDDKILTKQKQIEDRKIIGLIKGNGKGTDPEKVIFNFSSYMLSDNDNSFLPKGLHFSLPKKKLKLRNTFALLIYLTVKLVILAKIVLINNFSKVS